MKASNMELKPNTYYRTREGRKAYVVGKSPFKEDEDRGFIGFIQLQDDYSDYVIWNGKGETGNSPKDESDLIAEWKEPQRKTVWVGMRDDGFATLNYDTPHDLKTHYGSKVLAMRRVELVEGEFDE